MKKFLCLIAPFSMALAACTPHIAPLPDPLTAYGRAEQSADLAIKTADAFVKDAHPNDAKLAVILAGEQAVKSAVHAIRVSAEAGGSWTTDALNAAIEALVKNEV